MSYSRLVSDADFEAGVTEEYSCLELKVDYPLTCSKNIETG